MFASEGVIINSYSVMTGINWNYLVLDKPVHIVSLSLPSGLKFISGRF